MKKRMLGKLVLMMGLVLALAGCGGNGGAAAGTEAGNAASGTETASAGEAAAQESETAGSGITFQTTDLDGNAVDSGELFAQNKITMINIWGTYCGPCIEEMPELEEISKEYADKGVAVVGLVVDVTEGDDAAVTEARSIMTDTGATFQNLKAWDGFDSQLSAPGTPTTYFVDSQGNLVGDPVVGADAVRYRQTLDELLKL